MTEEMKICKDCGIEYPKTSEFFYYSDKKRGYFQSYCKGCGNKRSAKRQQENREKCQCSSLKWYRENREKVREQQAKYYQRNKEKRRQKVKEYYQDNSEHIKERQRKYSSLPETKKMVNKRIKRRRKEDASFRMRDNVSSMIRRYIRKAGAAKDNTTWTALPYTPRELREHLESQFEDWMSWENYGNGEGCWNIDHIAPQSKLLYDSLEHPNFLKCWALDNLRPLCYIENVRKGNRDTK